MTDFPRHTRTLIIGAGIHGLSTAYHLATKRRALGEEPGIVVIDKTAVAAGASGIACGVVRNNYLQTPMRALMAHSVGVWESDPTAYHYHSVGYIHAGPATLTDNLTRVHQEQQAMGYPSTLVTGEAECKAYMRDRLHDWQATDTEVILDEHRGGYSNNTKALHGLATKARAAGVQIVEGVAVTALDHDGSKVRSVSTDQGAITLDELVIAVGPWARSIWQMLDKPAAISFGGADVPMWTYWSLQEGVLNVPPETLQQNDGTMPPVIHLDSLVPLRAQDTGEVVTDGMWGIYYKPDYHFNGIQGGAMPFVVPQPPSEVHVDPYGPASPHFVVGRSFAQLWCAALAFCQQRFEGCLDHYRWEPSGGIGCFTPDSFPVFDWVMDNTYLIADSNHGYKMIGIGDLVADVLSGDSPAVLAPFTFDRFARNEGFATSESPFPWN
ncbi:MAG: FAD-binding oxidoreductase [Alphaproteobacteria bacterium]|nr:FAD-binding oxidoreductase [Alphaproteobacteria bacterium]